MLANETLRTLGSAKIRLISHLSLQGLRPSLQEKFRNTGGRSPVPCFVLTEYYDEQQLGFLDLLANMRLKSLFLEIDTEDIQ